MTLCKDIFLFNYIRYKFNCQESYDYHSVLHCLPPYLFKCLPLPRAQNGKCLSSFLDKDFYSYKKTALPQVEQLILPMYFRSAAVLFASLFTTQEEPHGSCQENGSIRTTGEAYQHCKGEVTNCFATP